MASPRPKLVLFDIDLTLINAGGAGRRSFVRAWETLLPDHAFPQGIRFAGRTDPQIVRELLHGAGLDAGDDGFVRRFRDVYLSVLPEELFGGLKRGGGRVMPGANDLMDILAMRGVRQGLVTGNWFEGARLKLRRYGLWDRFALGSFGGDAEDRRRLPPLAVARAELLWRETYDPRDIWVVGDSELDVACAVANGYRALATATGLQSVAELQDAGADAVVESLEEAASLLLD